MDESSKGFTVESTQSNKQKALTCVQKLINGIPDFAIKRVSINLVELRDWLRSGVQGAFIYRGLSKSQAKLSQKRIFCSWTLIWMQSKMDLKCYDAVHFEKKVENQCRCHHLGFILQSNLLRTFSRSFFARESESWMAPKRVQKARFGASLCKHICRIKLNPLKSNAYSF